MRVVPIYNLRTWKLVAANEHRIAYRPTLLTFFLRLGWTLVAAFLLTALLIATETFREPIVAPDLTEEERRFVQEAEQSARDLLREQAGAEDYERISRQIEQDRAARAAESTARLERQEGLRQGIVLGINIFAGAIILFGVWPPMACAWARVMIEKDLRNEICVRSRGIFLRKRCWPQGHFDRIATWTMERYWFGRHSAVVGHAWEWIVQLSPRGLPSMPYVADAAIASEGMGPQFLIARQKHRPLENERAPESVRAFVKALRALTDLPASPPQTVEVRLAHGWLRSKQIRRAEHPLTYNEPVITERREFRSIDEIPPELRARMAEMLQSGNVTRHADGTIEATSHTVKTIEGDEIDVNWDQLPPEIREQIERLRGKRG